MANINFFKNAFNLSTTENMILDSVRKLCKNFLSISLKDDYKNGGADRKVFKQFGNLGLLGPTINEYNCLGSTYKMYGLIAKEIEYIDSGYRSMFSVQSSLVMNPIYKYGNEFLKNKYLPCLASGNQVGCFGLTEPDSGSDASNMKTNAVYSDGKFIINGSKTWITNAPIADVYIIWAKFEGKINGFVLDNTMDGIETTEIYDKMSLKSSRTGMIFMNNVCVPEENKLDIIGMKGPFSCLNNARLAISFGAMGAAESCIETAINYSLDRKLFGQLLAEKQLCQNKIADMVSEYNLGLLASLQVANQVDNNDYNPEMISFVKRNNCYKALKIARESRDILGGNGISFDYNIFRHMINLETVNTYEGTFDIHSLILGNYFTGKKAF